MRGPHVLAVAAIIAVGCAGTSREPIEPPQAKAADRVANVAIRPALLRLGGLLTLRSAAKPPAARHSVSCAPAPLALSTNQTPRPAARAKDAQVLAGG